MSPFNKLNSTSKSVHIALKAPHSLLDLGEENTMYAFIQKLMMWTCKATRLLMTIGESTKVVASKLTGSSHSEISDKVFSSLS